MKPKELKDDKWALKAIEYLVRKDYSTKEVIDAMVEFGIRWGDLRKDINET